MPFYTRLKSAQADPVAEAVRKRTIAGIERLRTALAAHFPAGSDRMTTIRIGTWNVREFGTSKSGGRGFEPLYYIAEILSKFDLVAMQEVRENLRQFLDLLDILGPDWDYIATDVVDDGAGNGERMVFLYNRGRVQFRHIAGELTLPDGKKVLASFGERLLLQNGIELELPDGEDLSGDHKANSESRSNGKAALTYDLELPLPAGTMLRVPDGSSLAITKNSLVTRVSGRRGWVHVDVPQGTVAGKDYRLRFPGEAIDDSFKQFARTPFIVSFQAGWMKIDLATVHIYFGDNDEPRLLEQRRREIERLTELLGDRARKEMEKNPANPVLTALLGDFNILSKEHETMQALEANGFEVPEQIRTIPGSNVEKDKAYDQIAFWEPERDRGYVKVDIRGADVFDYFKYVYRLEDREVYLPGESEGAYRLWRTYKMSDHLPMWIELRSDFSDDYIAACDAAEP
ncbi:endonuclease [Altererythrobacter salegens]|uniref:Endonuclease n=1 Tax=Croceibacterium salegens TaxID=1737568 RepID=A0A6I4SUZ2_9SPHN|nr:endonuclease/exonuclease/phosphatase family protein [Croceibacterium salegens]MXO59308.1 endonuclease [Croceibacterium salegens]